MTYIIIIELFDILEKDSFVLSKNMDSPYKKLFSGGVGAVSGVISGIATAAPSATSTSPSSSGSPGVGCQSEHQDCNNVASHFE